MERRNESKVREETPQTKDAKEQLSNLTAKEPRKNKLVKLGLRNLAVFGSSAACMMQLLLNGFAESSKPLLWLWTNACGDNGQLRRPWSWLGVASAVWPGRLGGNPRAKQVHFLVENGPTPGVGK